MCGIALIINRTHKSINEPILQSMTDMVIHRGPDGSGIFIDKEVGLGHRRLSIIDLTECGKQPMSYKHLHLVFNGEIYNYVELREELKGLGYHFHSASDSEVLLLAYHEWGAECVHRLRGMWAFCIYDDQEKIIFLSRDRFGIKPLHYTQTPTYFLAGSEIKQFTVVDDFKSEMFHPIVYEFLQHGILNHNEYTFYKNVYSLKAGHNLIYNLKTHSFQIKQWYDLSRINKAKEISKEEAAHIFRQKFEEAIRLHLRSDVKLGSCLSGGMDSSSIVCATRNILGKEMPIYTVTSCNKAAAYDEREYAKAVADHCHTEEVLTFPDLNKLYEENLLEKITWHQDQPIGSGSHFSEYAVFEAARKNNLIVMLDGQGSDEYLAGYHEFFMVRCMGLFKKKKWRTLHRTIVERARNRNIPVKSIYLTLLKRLLGNNQKKADIHNWLDKDWATIQKGSPAVTFEGITHIDNIRDLSLLEIQQTSIPYQLHSEDRNSMLFSIESRVPFLDHELVEAMFGLPDDVYYNYGVDKAPIRQGLKGLLPEKIVNRKTKLGFVSSDALWMKEHAEEVRKRLEEAVAFFKGILNTGIINKFDQYVAGTGSYDDAFFRILSLYAWAKASKIKL